VRCMCCSALYVLQCVAVHCNVVRLRVTLDMKDVLCIAAYCSVLQCVAGCRSLLQCVPPESGVEYENFAVEVTR